MDNSLIPPNYGYVPIDTFFSDSHVSSFYRLYIEDLISSRDYTDSEKLLIWFIYEYEARGNSMILDLMHDMHDQLSWSREKFKENIQSLIKKEVLFLLDAYENSHVVSLSYAYVRKAEQIVNTHG